MGWVEIWLCRSMGWVEMWVGLKYVTEDVSKGGMG